MRCYEQIRVNLALLSEVRPMNVNLIGVGAGYSYVVSGPTHQCYEDITLMRAMPNFQVLSPADHVTAASLFDRCISTIGPKYLRLDAQVLPALYQESLPDLEMGFHIHRTGKTVCFVATGFMLHTAFKVADNFAAMGQSVGVIDLFDLSTFSQERLHQVLSSYSGIITLEEGFRGRGGLDSMIFDFMARKGMTARMLNIGVKGAYRFELGSRTELHEQAGIGPETVQQQVTSFLQSFSLIF